MSINLIIPTWAASIIIYLIFIVSIILIFSAFIFIAKISSRSRKRPKRFKFPVRTTEEQSVDILDKIMDEFKAKNDFPSDISDRMLEMELFKYIQENKLSNDDLMKEFSKSFEGEF